MLFSSVGGVHKIFPVSGKFQKQLLPSLSLERMPLCSYKVVRGTLDFSGVVGRVISRSKYGGMYILTPQHITYLISLQQNGPSRPNPRPCLSPRYSTYVLHRCRYTRTLYR